MTPVDITGRTRAIGAPVDWDQKLDGSCAVLPVRDAIDLQSGVNFMESLWQPSTEDMRLMNLGLPVLLRISGTIHPMVSAGAAQPSDVPEPVEGTAK